MNKEEMENSVKIQSDTLTYIHSLEKKAKQLESENYEQNNIINSYIEERQAVIDKLKEDIELARKEYRITLNDRQDGIRQEAEEILTILEGEKKWEKLSSEEKKKKEDGFMAL